VLIVFARAARGESIATIYRTDGVVVELPSYSRKHRVPHDLAHAVTEREFGLADGVFGSIVAGAMFDNMRIVAGRPRHDAAARSTRILTANKQALTLAEVMAGMLHHAVEGPPDAFTTATEAVRRGWGSIRQEPFPWTDDQVITAVDTLRDHAHRWATLGPEDSMEFLWPDRLTEPVPPSSARRRSRQRFRR
jgi:hypothetical protein